MEVVWRAATQEEEEESRKSNDDLPCFLRSEWTVYHDYAQQGQTVNVIKKFSRNCVAQWDGNELLCGKVATWSRSWRLELAEKYVIIQLRQVPGNLKLALCDFWLLPKFKKERHNFKKKKGLRRNNSYLFWKLNIKNDLVIPSSEIFRKEVQYFFYGIFCV